MIANHVQQNHEKPAAQAADVVPKKAYIVFAIVALALLMSSIDSTIVSVSLPSMLGDLNTNLALLGWTITGYMFAQSIVMPIVGKISDEWGRKKVFLACVALFSVASMAAGLAPNVYWLIIFRIIQGLGGGSFLPSATGVVADAFGSRRRATAIGLFGSIFPIGGILGPNVGGFIIEHLSWRWIFFVNIPIGITVLVLGSMILPKSTSVPSNRNVDILGSGIFSMIVVSVLLAMTIMGNNPNDPGIWVWVLFGVGIVMVFAFVWRENRAPNPVIDLKLLHWRPLLAANIYNFIFGAIVFGFSQFIPYYATVAYGMTPEQNGILLTPQAITMIIVSALTSFFIIRLRYRIPMIVGICIISFAIFLLSRGYHDVNILGIGLHNLVLLSIIVAIQGAGMGIANPASNNAALDLMPERVAVVTGLRSMFRSVGGVFGTATVVLALSHFQDQTDGVQKIFFTFSLLLPLLIPLVFLIPDKISTVRKDAVSGMPPE